MENSPRCIIREVDGADEADVICELHKETFGDSAPPIDPAEKGYWWLAYVEDIPIGFAGLTQSTAGENIGYLKRVGVLKGFRGNGLQKRFLRVREAKARKLGWSLIITDTTDNIASANSLISAGYRLYSPAGPWAFRDTLYWRKKL